MPVEITNHARGAFEKISRQNIGADFWFPVITIGLAGVVNQDDVSYAYTKALHETVTKVEPLPLAIDKEITAFCPKNNGNYQWILDNTRLSRSLGYAAKTSPGGIRYLELTRDIYDRMTPAEAKPAVDGEPIDDFWKLLDLFSTIDGLATLFEQNPHDQMSLVMRFYQANIFLQNQYLNI